MNKPYNFQQGDPVELTARLMIVPNRDKPQEKLYFIKGEIGIFYAYTQDKTFAYLKINDENGENYQVEFEVNHLTFPEGLTSREQLPKWKLDHNWEA